MKTPAAEILDGAGPYLVGPYLEEFDLGRLVNQIVERYEEPWRRHHTVAHLGDVVSFLVENVDELKKPRPTLWAALGHDSIYVPQALPGANEELSAQLTEKQLERHLITEELLIVGRDIRATARHKWDGKDTDLAYLLDADLKILGAPEDEFETYDKNIRLEYSFVEEEVYRSARAKILKEDFYDQKRLFITDVAYERYEDQAKANLERKIDELLAN